MNINIPVNLKYTPTGCGDYTSYVEILSALRQQPPSFKFFVWFNTDYKQFPVQPNDIMSFIRLDYPFWCLGKLRYWFWLNTLYPFKIGNKKNRYGFFINQKMPFAWRGQSIVRIQDLAFIFFEDCFRLKDLIRLKADTAVAVRKANHLFAISESTKKDLINVYGIHENKITVTYNGINSIFKPMKDLQQKQTVKKKYGITHPYILFVGVIQKRKNLIRLLQAFEILNERQGMEYDLVIVGQKGWLYDEFFEYLRNMKQNDSVILTGGIDDQDLLYLYNGAEAFILPSLYEGFGIPIAEAMACGVPTLASNCSSMPEVGGDAALYFDPYSHEDIANSLMRVLNDEALRVKMRHKGIKQAAKFNWDNTASLMLKTFARIFK